MAAKNNFKKLEEEQLRQTPSAPPEIESNVKGTVRVFQFMGDIVELYLPKVFDMFVTIMGGEKKNEEEVKNIGNSNADTEFSEGEQKPDL